MTGNDNQAAQAPTADDLRFALAEIDVAGFGDCVDNDSVIEDAARAYLAILTGTAAEAARLALEPKAVQDVVLAYRPDLAAIWHAASETGDGSGTQAARDALLPFACRACGAEASEPGEPDHFAWCPSYPDAVADAKTALFERILNRVRDGQEREAAERLLMDLLDLAEGNLSREARDELVAQVLGGAGRKLAVRWEVANGEVITVVADTEAGAVQVAFEPDDPDEPDDDKYDFDPDPNPSVWVRRAGGRGTWRRVHVS